MTKPSNEQDIQSYQNAVATKQAELGKVFNKFVQLKDPGKLKHVEEILSRIGTIDAEIEGLKTSENQRDLTLKFHWGHNHRFNEQLRVPGRMGDRHLNLMSQFMVRYNLSPYHFENKDVIDVGCWTGGTTLLLKALGARTILALEEVQKYAKTAKELATDIYDLDGITCDGGNLFDLRTDNKYDIIYFPGVIYHLSDPVLALRRLFNATKDGGEIFIESAGIDAKTPICRYEGNQVFNADPEKNEGNLNRGGWNWFLPSPSCLGRWMSEAGFDEIDCFFSKASHRVFGYGKRTKFYEITRAGLSVRDVE